MKTPQMLRAQGLAILEECKDDFSPVMRLIDHIDILAVCVAGMGDAPDIFADAVERWSTRCKKRGTDERIETAGIKCLTEVYNRAYDERKKREQAKNKQNE